MAASSTSVIQAILQAQYADKIEQALACLRQAQPPLDTPENITLLTQQAPYADKIAQALWRLSKTQPRLDTQENFILLIQQAQYADKLAEGVECLCWEPRLDTQANFIILIQQAQYADKISRALLYLSQAMPRLDMQENFILLSQHAPYADKLAPVLLKLCQAVPRLDTQENFNTLVQYREFLQEILNADIVNQQVFDEVIQNINTLTQSQKVAFSCGSHSRLGANSSLRLFFNESLSDPQNLAPMIFEFLPKAH